MDDIKEIIQAIRKLSPKDRERVLAVPYDKEPGYYFLTWGAIIQIRKSGVTWLSGEVPDKPIDVDDWGPRIPTYDHTKHAGMKLDWIPEGEQVTIK